MVVGREELGRPILRVKGRHILFGDEPTLKRVSDVRGRRPLKGPESDHSPQQQAEEEPQRCFGKAIEQELDEITDPHDPDDDADADRDDHPHRLAQLSPISVSHGLLSGLDRSQDQHILAEDEEKIGPGDAGQDHRASGGHPG